MILRVKTNMQSRRRETTYQESAHVASSMTAANKQSQRAKTDGRDARTCEHAEVGGFTSTGSIFRPMTMVAIFGGALVT